MIAEDVVLGQNVTIHHPELVNLYGCRIGDGTSVASFVEIQKGVSVGKNVKIQPFAFIPEGVQIGDEVFIGPHACFTNDRHPRAANIDGSPKGREDWTLEETTVEKGASIGANATILCGLTIGERAVVAAGALVLGDVPAGSIVAGVPAKVVGEVDF